MVHCQQLIMLCASAAEEEAAPTSHLMHVRILAQGLVYTIGVRLGGDYHRLPRAIGPGLRNHYATELGGKLPAEAWPYSLVIHDEHTQSPGHNQAGIQLGDPPTHG